MKDKQLVYLYVIADRKKKEALLDELAASGAALMSFVYARGYYEQRTMLDLLGLNEEKGKILISCLMLREKSAALIEILNEKFSFASHDSGIAFTIPVEKLVY